MTDLYKAMEVEKAYLELIPFFKKKNDFNLVSKLAECGYTLDEFHKDKNEMLVHLNTLDIRMTTIETFQEDEEAIMAKGDSGMIVAIPQKEYIFEGQASTVEANAPIVELALPCNSIIATSLDVSISIVVKQRREIQYYLRWLNTQLDDMGLHRHIESSEKALANGYSIYYFQVTLEPEKREKVRKIWLV